MCWNGGEIFLLRDLMGRVPCGQAEEAPGCFWNLCLNPSCPCSVLLWFLSGSLLLLSDCSFDFSDPFFGRRVLVQGSGQWWERVWVCLCAPVTGGKEITFPFPMNNSSAFLLHESSLHDFLGFLIDQLINLIRCSLGMMVFLNSQISITDWSI